MSTALVTAPLRDNLRPAKHGCYAQVPGTGPAGRTCRGCGHFHDLWPRGVVRHDGKGKCKKYGELTSTQVDSCGVISAGSPACLYWFKP